MVRVTEITRSVSRLAATARPATAENAMPKRTPMPHRGTSENVRNRRGLIRVSQCLRSLHFTEPAGLKLRWDTRKCALAASGIPGYFVGHRVSGLALCS